MSETVTYDGTEYTRSPRGHWIAIVGTDATTQYLQDVCDFFDLVAALAASQAETLELRQRVLDSANGMDRLNARIAELERLLSIFDITKCGECGGQGWTVEYGGTPTPEQVLCRDCASVGYVQADPQHLQQRIAELEQEREDVRRVEAWCHAGAQREVRTTNDGGWESVDWAAGAEDDGQHEYFAPTLAALGRMLKGVADAPLSSSQQAQNTEGENG